MDFFSIDFHLNKIQGEEHIAEDFLCGRVNAFAVGMQF